MKSEVLVILMLLGMLSVTMAQQPTTHPQKQQVRRDIERDTLMLQQVVGFC